MLTVEKDRKLLLAMHERAVRLSTDAAGAVTADRLGVETPCRGWDLRALLAHMTTQNYGFAAAARGRGDDLELWEVREWSDPVGDYLAASVDVVAAFAVDDIFERSFALPEIVPGMPFPAGVAITMHLVDSVVHAWDVARSIGLTVDPDEELAHEALRIAAAVPDDENRLEPSAAFAPALDLLDNDSLLDQTLRLLGRDPDWAPAVR
ncbi:TIGR03086 family metal-binding protein [Nocardia sp. NPDC052566]|uniref:TIGR03086 family metal-binding protein n=1 Tax=Nocardia sp. NPDC052566 TaxID=3364330 RepID=UPI0037C54D83